MQKPLLLAYRQTDLNQLVMDRIEKYLTRSATGELVCTAGYKPNHIIHIAANKPKQLKALIFFLVHGYFTSSQIQTLSKTLNSCDPAYFYLIDDIQRALEAAEEKQNGK